MGERRHHELHPEKSIKQRLIRRLENFESRDALGKEARDRFFKKHGVIPDLIWAGWGEH